MNIFKKYMGIVLLSCVIVVLTAFLVYCAAYFYNKRTIDCGSRKKLSELMGVDFRNIEIVEIIDEYVPEDEGTDIYVFINETRPLVECEYYKRQSEKLQIPYGHIEILEELGIQVEDIAELGIAFKEIRVGYSISPYATHWYRIHDTVAQNGNVVFITWIPRKVSLNVEKILADK